MQEHHEMMELNEHLTDVEIMRAIRYLDPDLRADKAGKDTRADASISFTSVCVLTGAWYMSASPCGHCEDAGD